MVLNLFAVWKPVPTPSIPPKPSTPPTPPKPNPIIEKIPAATGPELAFTDTKSVDPERAEAIKWLSRTGVTVGSGCVAGGGKNCKFNPTAKVNRGAMAQFLQKLAGVTDGALKAKYAGKTMTLSDIGKLKSANPARYNAILWLAETKVTVGCGGTKFCPNSSVNRGSMAQFMQKFANETNAPSQTSAFPDVNPQDTQLKYDSAKKTEKVTKTSAERIGAINWLAEKGITTGSGKSAGKNTFRPQDPVTRGSMAQFMRRLANLMMK
jgi:hypothetical protein